MSHFVSTGKSAAFDIDHCFHPSQTNLKVGDLHDPTGLPWNGSWVSHEPFIWLVEHDIPVRRMLRVRNFRDRREVMRTLIIECDVGYMIEDPELAMLAKLTWGGK